MEQKPVADTTEFPKTIDRWTTALGTLTGVSSILAVIQGRDAIDRLTHDQQVTVARLLYIGLACAVIAIVTAQMASWGFPQRPEKWKKNWSANYGAANTVPATGPSFFGYALLATSLVTALLAVILVGSASQRIWFGELEPDRWIYSQAGTPVAGTPMPGTVYCGFLETDQSTGGLMIELEQAVTALDSVPVSDAKLLAETDKCPTFDR